MGGSLFNTKRLPYSEFAHIADEIIQKFSSTKIKVDIPDWYATKPDFGDLDLVVYDQFNEFEQLKIDNGWVNGISNGNCYSFPYKNFQVDIIFTTKRTYETTLNFMSFNDLGNLIGKIARTRGLKYGYKGLVYEFRDEKATHYKADIILTRNMQEICIELNLDWHVWYKGFETREDMFKWITSSRFFTKSAFLFENQTNRTRVRDRKRSTIQAFCQWMDTTDIELNTGYVPKVTTKELLINWEDFSYNFFYHYDKLQRSYQISKKFNGDIIMNLTGLQGKELGAFIKDVKAELDKTYGSWQDYAIQHRSHQIREYITNTYNDYIS